MVNVRYVVFLILFMPVTITASVLLSLPFGGSLDQLHLSPEFSIVSGSVIGSWVVAILAPMLEELGWSSYGIDSLRGKTRLIFQMLFFGLFWSIWHMPLFFIHGYYHSNLLAASPWFAVNFLVSVVPLAVIKYWLYYRNNRIMLMSILFHILVNVSSEAFSMTNTTKCIETGVIAVIAILVVVIDRRFLIARASQLPQRPNKRSPHQLSTHTEAEKPSLAALD